MGLIGPGGFNPRADFTGGTGGAGTTAGSESGLVRGILDGTATNLEIGFLRAVGMDRHKDQYVLGSLSLMRHHNTTSSFSFREKQSARGENVPITLELNLQ